MGNLVLYMYNRIVNIGQLGIGCISYRKIKYMIVRIINRGKSGIPPQLGLKGYGS
jgi:hypothetical protein